MKTLKTLFAALALTPCLFAQDIASVSLPELNQSHPEEDEVVEVSSQEKHFSNLRQLTFGGDNAEAYFSFDGKKLTFQSNNPTWGLKCDQIFWMDIEEAADNRIYQPLNVSNLQGRTTCSYYMPDNKRIIYASTFKSGTECPPAPETSGRYLWSIDPNYDIFVGDEKGKVLKQLTEVSGYDAEAVVSPKGDKILFTSTRDGDLDLYIMDINGKNVKRLTNTLGYDGGAFFSPDGSKIVFRASRPLGTDTIDYKSLLAKGLVAPTNMEIFTMNADGSNLQQITKLGKANWAPFYHPSGNKIIFSSNHHSDKGYDFQLFMVNTDGTGLEQITFESKFNAFPMFSPDGKKLVFSSNRNNGGTRDTNVFIADWVE
jgi:Tol biopolymer transport system component